MALLFYSIWFRGGWINPEWMALFTSRGSESAGLKAFMRATVLVSDLLVYFPAVLVFCYVFVKPEGRTSPLSAAFLMLLHPSILLIDYGHFQYNCVMLGLAIWGIILVSSGRVYLGSVFFCLSIFFKQMALYYALPFFFYLLGKSFQSQPPIKGYTFFQFPCLSFFLSFFLSSFRLLSSPMIGLFKCSRLE